ncbi:hypothetical protein [Micromonospora sp. NPDC023633]|uniref:hypothetical protein n=1 Tax=Micromonospora sp. NPDC023633 TaxID=3154320 RepID=UPI0033EDFBB6
MLALMVLRGVDDRAARQLAGRIGDDHSAVGKVDVTAAQRQRLADAQAAVGEQQHQEPVGEIAVRGEPVDLLDVRMCGSASGIRGNLTPGMAMKGSCRCPPPRS